MNRKVGNFGDLLGPLIIHYMLGRLNLTTLAQGNSKARLVSVGSTLHLAKTGDVIWGTGVNGKIARQDYNFSQLDVRSVRGPLTAAFLGERGIKVPRVFGDPALLTGRMWPKAEMTRPGVEHPITVIPNLNDMADYAHISSLDGFVSPLTPVKQVVARIAASQFVCGSSLHAIVIADAYGIPARLIRSPSESPVKYEDYYLGTGRGGYTSARSLSHAVSMGGEPAMPFDASPLLAAFPMDIWVPKRTSP